MLQRPGGREKKLADAARHWAAWQQGGATFSVWPENAQTLQVFLALDRCWRIDGMSGQCLGLDRSAIESTLRLLQIHRRQHRKILLDLLLMEQAVLEVLEREQKRKGA